ncbi:MAG: hypothetical protein CM15mP71_5300 [Candidatus Poseidoniales archaeon]|nr:MAG: hypothetical protein CM15mP71_5300 [Candidatus Poseidoniales archaeon]
MNPQVPVDLVIDHSVQVDISGANPEALDLNLDIEYHRNMERYTFLKWGQQSLKTSEQFLLQEESSTRLTWNGLHSCTPRKRCLAP